MHASASQRPNTVRNDEFEIFWSVDDTKRQRATALTETVVDVVTSGSGGGAVGAARFAVVLVGHALVEANLTRHAL